MKSISLKLPEAMLRKLEQSANRSGLNKSDLLRDALERFLDEEHKAFSGSLLEIAGPLIGCVEGPGDLSYNPEHLESFGR